jgi:hypothetical protein
MGDIAFEIDTFAAAARSRPRAVHQALTVGAHFAHVAHVAASAAIASARRELDAIAAAGGKSISTSDTTGSFLADRRAESRGRTHLAAGATVEWVVAGVLAGLAAALIAGVTGEPAGPVARSLPMRGCWAGLAACATVGHVARGVDAGVVAGELRGCALSLAGAVGTYLPGRAGVAACAAMTGVARQVGAGIATRAVSGITSYGAVPL